MTKKIKTHKNPSSIFRKPFFVESQEDAFKRHKNLDLLIAVFILSFIVFLVTNFFVNL